MHSELLKTRCPSCQESVAISNGVECAETICEWCATSFLFVFVDGSPHLVDLADEAHIVQGHVDGLVARIGIPYVDVEVTLSRGDFVQALSLEQCLEQNVVPLHGAKNTLLLAAASPGQLQVLDSIDPRIASTITPCLASRDAIHRGLHLRPFSESEFDCENAAIDSRGQIAQAHSRARLAADQYWRSLGDAASRDYSRYADHLFTIQKRLLADEHGIEWRSPLDVEH